MEAVVVMPKELKSASLLGSPLVSITLSYLLNIDQRSCHMCGSFSTRIVRQQNGKASLQWLYVGDRITCYRCYSKIKRKEWDKRTVEEKRKYNHRVKLSAITFGGKQIQTSVPKLRTGYCSRCSNNIHDGSCKLTHLHHKQYFRVFPWFATEELCASCHAKESDKLWRKYPDRKKICTICGSDKTYTAKTRDGKDEEIWWFLDKGKELYRCGRCYSRVKARARYRRLKGLPV
jgi:hypothetical protein